MDVSLDELIKKQKKAPISARGRGGARRGITRNQTSSKKNDTTKTNTSQFKRGGVVKGNVRANPRAKLGDARTKIIQKNRAKLTDARDKLAQLAKQTDARFKLQKLRGNNIHEHLQNQSFTRNIGVGSLTLKTNRNGQLSLSTKSIGGHNRSNSFKPGYALKSGPGRMHPYRPPVIPNYDFDALNEPSYLPSPVGLRRSIKNDMFSVHIPTIKRTVKNDMHVSSMPPLPDIRPMWGSTRSRSPPMSQIRSSLSPRVVAKDLNMKVTLKRSMGALSLKRTFGNDIDDSSRKRIHRLDRLGGIHSRLDTLPQPVRTMGILSSLSKNMNQPIGTRIVVSNLQPNVTQEDIKELFEDVGELLESRLVRPGTAEVIFKTLDDAQKAVEVYHNRQLDGQPMKCLLVNPRSSNKPTAPALRSLNATYPRSSNLVRKVPISKSSVEPDVDTFHSVMFKRRS